MLIRLNLGGDCGYRFFKNCPKPNENQRQQLSEELRLEPKQIKFWFQNKRNQRKAENNRANCDALKIENESFESEILALKEALLNILCPTCDIFTLRNENMILKQQHESLSKTVENILRKRNRFPEIQSMLPSVDMGTYGFDSHLNVNSRFSDISTTTYHLYAGRNNEEKLMIDIACNAVEELFTLSQYNEPVWIKSFGNGRYIINQDFYNKTFERNKHHESITTRTESSKCLGMVATSAVQLLELFIDSVHPQNSIFLFDTNNKSELIFVLNIAYICFVLQNKWADLFPTIVTKARTIEVIDTSMLGDQAGSMQLMYGKIHALSPVVAPREFYFIRYCRQVGQGFFVMVDVPYDRSGWNYESTSFKCRRKPSGCVIKVGSSGYSEVTWIEHVEVEDTSLIHCVNEELIQNCAAYGAQRWILALQRMIERVACSTMIHSPSHAIEEGIMPEERAFLMNFTHGMIKTFWENLNKCEKLDFPIGSDTQNNDIWVSVRPSDVPNQLLGMVVSAYSSIWLGTSREALFDFLDDEKSRVQWDNFTEGNSVNATVYISFGSHPGNRVSIFQPSILTETSAFILQESWSDPLGSLIVYAPMTARSIKSVLTGEDWNVPILPVGFIISGDQQSENPVDGASTSSSSGGSILTMFHQVFAETQEDTVEVVARLNHRITSTMCNIKSALYLRALVI